jgi:hypothetical protein
MARGATPLQSEHFGLNLVQMIQMRVKNFLLDCIALKIK